jgi:hypothetical protein
MSKSTGKDVDRIVLRARLDHAALSLAGAHLIDAVITLKKIYIRECSLDCRSCWQPLTNVRYYV